MKSIRLYDGLRVAYQEWGAQHASKVLAVHGWLDNSNSFKYLGPYLADRGYHVVAMDILGHGHSDHLGIGAQYTVQKATSVAREVVDIMGWKKSHFIGHCMVISKDFGFCMLHSIYLSRVLALASCILLLATI